MEPEAKYTLVGSVVIILVAFVAAAVVWLRSTGEGANANQYKIYFKRQTLEGLEPRSNVTMRGMRVGSVTGFRFSRTVPGAVEVFIAVDPTTPIRQSTRATAERHLVTGLAAVRLVNLTEDSPLLVEPPDDEPVPVIREGESSMEQVTETLNELAIQAGDTMRRLNTMLTIENRNAFSETLENLRRVSRRLDATLSRADATLGSVGLAADEVRSLAGTVAADARVLTERYAALGTQATTSAQEIGEAVRKLSADADRLSRRADTLLAGGEEELRETARAVRSAADSLGAAAGRLRDPREMIYGPAEGGLGPGERAR
jgi:phospholipid/cholesterol/gamma-HCH transport system substrate-binding protein